MSAFDVVLAVYAVILALAGLAIVYRMIVGPTILDRAISSDSLVTLVVMGLALHVAHSGAAWAGPAMLSLTGLAFVGTVTFARFVAREDPMQGRRRPHSQEPDADTGPHEAIHLETDSASEDGFATEGDFVPEDGFASEDGSGGEDGFGREAGTASEDGALVPEDEHARVLGAGEADEGSEEGFGLDGTTDGSDAGDQGFEDDDRLADGPTGGAR
ncbi:monovalent cation/H+ antiporter complex subunit F [Brachybacterium paraconglomeratum]|uniref:monovalent cation/H+ antiporter complex subunit F n=1 Tax=Brachybacterium paraconglomeratum TaxID=173362 RepID=UPI0021E4A0B4|nr:monovalent cation/H+ antiporter complex subunit F [Brachybacterium paraconglomeratum]MCT1437262.1 monovalent cation/H+ antiporter complex subunit F [Brachybacterium paraconglomeratum]